MKISITNVIQWKKTAKGTRDMFESENIARQRHYDRLNEICVAETSESVENIKKRKRELSENYFNDGSI